MCVPLAKVFDQIKFRSELGFCISGIGLTYSFVKSLIFAKCHCCYLDSRFYLLILWKHETYMGNIFLSFHLFSRVLFFSIPFFLFSKWACERKLLLESPRPGAKKKFRRISFRKKEICVAQLIFFYQNFRISPLGGLARSTKLFSSFLSFLSSAFGQHN